MGKLMSDKIGVYGYHSDANKNPTLLWGLANASRTDYKEIEYGSFGSSNPSAPILVYDRQIAELQKEIRELREMLTNVMQSQEVPLVTNYITLRDIPVEQAKEEIARYFRDNDGKEIDIDELIEVLAIEPRTVVISCNELEAEGRIG
jgi:hypothetical protein